MENLRKLIPLKIRILFGPYINYISYIFKKYIVSSSKKPEVLSLEETLTLIIDKKLSAIRFGDGEISLIHNEELGFQKHNLQLIEKLKSILKVNAPGLLICIPGIWKSLNHFSKKSYWFTLHHLFKHENSWKNAINPGQIFGDAYITRPYLIFKDSELSGRVFKSMQSIWSGESVTLIEGSKSRLGVGNDLFNNAKSVKRILCPSENAYEKYEQIKEESLKIDKNELVLLSLGPTAKVLAYDLFLEGYRVIDIGHIDMEYEMFLRGSKELIEVPYKYFNEIEARNPEDCKDPVYLSQIIARIE